MRYGVIVEAGNCIYCGRHINDGSDIFLCEECRRKEEERKCLHEKLKEEEEMSNSWVFTFGCGRDVYGDKAGTAVRIFASSYDEARDKMFKRYGNKWAFQYSDKEWSDIERDPNRFWEMEEITEVIE